MLSWHTQLWIRRGTWASWSDAVSIFSNLAMHCSLITCNDRLAHQRPALADLQLAHLRKIENVVPVVSVPLAKNANVVFDATSAIILCAKNTRSRCVGSVITVDRLKKLHFCLLVLCFIVFLNTNKTVWSHGIYFILFFYHFSWMVGLKMNR